MIRIEVNKKQRLFISTVLFLCLARPSYCENEPGKFNVILISIDALRSDHLSCYGYRRNTSPHIDKLAEEGALFTQAIAQSSHTPPSVCSILTSALPNKHLLIGWGYSLNPELPTITGILKSKGYKTIFLGGNDNFQKGLPGFDKYFDVFYEDQSSEIITGKLMELINAASKEAPFFIWAHYMDVHAYKPSKPFDALFINDEWYDKQKELPVVKCSLKFYGFKGIPEALVDKTNPINNPDYYIARYDAAIRTVDEEIGKVVKYLKEHELYSKTIIIITSDHGEMLGEHNYYFHHGFFLFEPLINVPLIIKCEKIIPLRTSTDTQVSAHIDIAPTLLDLLKIAIPKKMEGVSLLDVILHKKRYTRRYVFSDEGWSLNCIRGENFKLTRRRARNFKLYELYNLKEDKQEQNNLVSKEDNIFRLLREKLDEYMQVSRENIVAKPSMDEETRNKLRSLGYAE